MTPPTCEFARATCCVLAIALVGSSAIAARSQELANDDVSVIQSVDAAPVAGGEGVIVTVRSNNPLPRPRIGVLEAPDRVYMDFRGVRLPPGLVAEWHGTSLRGVRLAQYSVDPLVARVVVDLHAPTLHRVQTIERRTGTVVLVLGGSQAQPASARASATRRYHMQLSETLQRLEALRPVLQSIDRRVAADADLLAAAVELETLSLGLSRIKAPMSYAPVHELLRQSCALGARAVRLRHGPPGGGDMTAAFNAPSAAAGALMLLDRALQSFGTRPAP